MTKLETVFPIVFMSMIIVGAILFVSIGIVDVYAEPVSYWNFDDNLNDYGYLDNGLKTMDPVFKCSIQVVIACWPDSWLALTSVNYVNSINGKANMYNGFTYFTAQPESDYDFLDINHPYKVEFEAKAIPLCNPKCTHQYLMSKAKSDNAGNVYGFAIGIHPDGKLYVYHRSNQAIVFVKSNDIVFDNVPRHFTVTNDGSGTWEGINIFVDGIKNKAPYDSSLSVPIFTGTDDNDEAFVIGNYWYRTGQTFRTGWIDEIKVFDYDIEPTPPIEEQPVINNPIITDDQGNSCMIRARADGSIYCQH